VLPGAVIPAKAGIHSADLRKRAVYGLDSRFRGNDLRTATPLLADDTTTRLVRVRTRGSPKVKYIASDLRSGWRRGRKQGRVRVPER
jgi:hypothetical protein